VDTVHVSVEEWFAIFFPNWS